MSSEQPFESGYLDWEPSSSPSSDPTPAAMAWVEATSGHRVLDWVALPGGMSSAVHRLLLDGPTGSAVLRRYTLADWLEREPDIPYDEARILTMLGAMDVGVATPTLLAADPDGIHCDVPAVLMTEVPGRPNIDPPNPDRWACDLAACLAGIHAVPIPDGLTAVRRWDHPESPVPTWVTDRDLWRRAKQTAAGPLPEHEPVFLHRDFHPNNVHWEHGSIAGVVDWLSACVGPAAVDLAHCRWNLAILIGIETAELFTETYRGLTGYRESVIAHDVSTIMSGPVGPFPTFAWNDLGRHDLTSQSVAERIEAWLAHIMSGG